MLGRFGTVVLRRAAVAAFVTTAAMPAWSETLAQALTSAYLNSGLLEQNRATLRAADEDVAQAVAALRPVLRWTANVERRWGTSGSLQTVGAEPWNGIPGTRAFVVGSSVDNSATVNLIAEMMLFDAGRSKLGIDAAKETVLATRAGLIAVEQQILFRAASAFMEMRRAVENVALRENNVRVIRQEVRAARDRFDVGEVTRTDVALAEARLSAAQSALAAAQGSLVAAREEYAAIVGHKPKGLESPRSLPKLPAQVDAAKAKAVRAHPSMQQAQHQVSAAEVAILIAETQRKPTVSLNGGVSYSSDLQSRNFSRGGNIGISAGGPIYSGGALNSAIRQTKARRDAARGALHVVQQDIIQNVGNSYVQLRVAQASRASFEAQVRAATVAFRGVREEAKLGARTTLDVLDAEQELLNARASLISAQVDEAIASYAVLASMGLLTAEALHLNVPSFDPEAYYNLVKTAPAGISRQGQELDRVLKALGKD